MATAAASVDELTPDALVTRQPVFRPDGTLDGYRLCASSDAPVAPAEPSPITRQTLHAALDVIGLDALLAGTRLYLPMPVANLLDGDHVVLPPDRTVLELTTFSGAVSEAVDAVGRARGDGFTIAVSAALDPEAFAACLPHADIVEVRLGDADMDERVQAAGAQSIRLLVEGVDDHADQARAGELGAALLHGRYFCTPDTVSSRAHSASRTAQMRLLTALGQTDLDFADVESIIKSDAVLASSLLKYLNSAAFGMRQSITSIRHALTLLGERPLRKWGTLVAFAGMCDGKPHELLVASLVRAHFCEGVASAIGQELQAIDYFLVGLLSTIDAVTDRPMSDALASVSVSEAVRRTLLDDDESSLTRTLALVRACEIGAWASVIRLGSELGLTHRDIAGRYYETLRSTHAFFE